MFKIYRWLGNSRREVKPLNNIYTVFELGDYELILENFQPSSLKDFIFLEDIPIDRSCYNIEGTTLHSNRVKFFQDYFGFATITIGSEVFKFNILIEKLKLSEIEDILMFLWQSDNKVFNNYFSKSTLKSKIDKKGTDFGLTSKFLVFANHFHDTMKRLVPYFIASPHTVLRKNKENIDYSPQHVTSHTVNWLLANLDNIKFDSSYSNFPGAFKLEQSYGYVDKIETERNIRSYNVYENQIILGGFVNLLAQLKGLKREITSNVNLSQHLDGEFADFRDLKKIPFVKLFEDSKSVERNLNKLFLKYKTIFGNTICINEKPKVTPIFKSKSHYQLSYKLIRNLRELKFDFDGELQLLNIKKLSHLYEVYNLHHIISNFSNKLNLEYFSVNTETSRIDGIMNKISYLSSKVGITIFYELKYADRDSETKLVRLDKGYYRPDFIIEIISEQQTKYYILDSKYSFEHTTIGKHLPECIFKYLLNTGIKDEEYKKPDYIVLLFPGNHDYSYVENDYYSPKIKCIVSKPKFENNLKALIESIIEKEIHANYYSNSKELIN